VRRRDIGKRSFTARTEWTRMYQGVKGEGSGVTAVVTFSFSVVLKPGVSGPNSAGLGDEARI
jgi:hypothetical protein